jgi:hypothetical protein
LGTSVYLPGRLSALEEALWSLIRAYTLLTSVQVIGIVDEYHELQDRSPEEDFELLKVKV